VKGGRRAEGIREAGSCKTYQLADAVEVQLMGVGLRHRGLT